MVKVKIKNGSALVPPCQIPVRPLQCREPAPQFLPPLSSTIPNALLSVSFAAMMMLARKKIFRSLSLSLLVFSISIAVSAQKKPVTDGHASVDKLSLSPENHVYQFVQQGSCLWPDSSTTKSTLYLWVPENCVRLKALLILCSNVPEQMLAGHPAIRKACAESNMGIVWAVPSFLNFRKTAVKDKKPTNMALEHPVTVAFLQQMLDGLAKTSGYDEVATVPWLPMGESGHLLMVDALLENSPQRCIAGVFIKNNHLPPHERTTPVLTIFGTAQEWAQEKSDIRSRWNAVDTPYRSIVDQRKSNPAWPLSYVIDGHSGHFDCSEKITAYIADYIRLAAKARLPEKQGAPLLPLSMAKGFSAGLPVPGHLLKKPFPYSEKDSACAAMPWYFDKKQAEEAYTIADIDWKAATQLPGFLTDSGKTARFEFNGISKYVPSEWGQDGITFSVSPVMLDKIPENFAFAGQPLGAATAKPKIEWVCGQFKPIGGDKFQVCLDRTWSYTANYLGVRQEAGPGYRGIFQPCGLTLTKNTTGKPQKISFDSIPDVKAGTRSLTLKAVSDASLPVRFFVVAGPAVIDGDRLVFSPIPPRTRFPVEVTVAAWQWGKPTEPKVKMAEIVKRKFLIHP